MTSTAPLARLVSGFGRLLDGTPDEPDVLDQGADLLGDLLADPRWLPASHAEAHPDRYQQHLLHRDPAGRFSVVSFVWGPGQSTPVHDHTTWGIIGVLLGAEVSTPHRFERGELVAGEPHRLEVGDIDRVSPTIGDVHQVVNAFDDRTSVSIHVYGADITTVRRSIYRPDGTAVPFTSTGSAVPALTSQRRPGDR